MRIAKLTLAGAVHRVLAGKEGMTFPIVHITQATGGQEVRHVADFRYPDPVLGRPYQVWSLGEDDCVELTENDL